MSKTVPVHGGSSRPCCPACAPLGAPRCLAASRVALPVHGVSTTPVTTPGCHQHEPTGQGWPVEATVLDRFHSTPGLRCPVSDKSAPVSLIPAHYSPSLTTVCPES